MRPELFRLPEALGGLPVPAYGVFLLLGALLGSVLFAWLVGRSGGAPGRGFEVALEMIAVGLVTAKVAGLWLMPPGTVWTAAVVAGSGGVWYFGFLGGIGYFSWRRQVLGLTWLDALDRMLPSVALGHAFGRIGCYLAGCCWGLECDAPWAVTFPEQAAGPGTGVPVGVALHPTQLYEAGAEVALCAALVFWLLNRRAFIGQIALIYLPAYAAVRLTLEFFRADYRGAVGALSTSQLIALVILAVTVPALAVAWRRGGLGRLSEPAPPPASRLATGPPSSKKRAKRRR